MSSFTVSRWTRVCVVLALALVAHLWMLNAPQGLLADGALPVASSTPLPAAPPCAHGMAACHVTEPDDRPVPPVLLLPVLLLAAAVANSRPDPAVDLPEVPGDARHDRSPPQPCVLSSVVLIE